MSPKLDIPKFIAPDLNNRKIPRIIHQTFETSKVPVNMYDAAMSWVEYNPDCEYRFYDNEARINLIKENFNDEVLQAYYLIENGAFRADLWRYCALYIYGGIYADIDTVCQMSMIALIKNNDEFIVPGGSAPHTIFNAFICSKPQHPFLKKAINRAVRIILSRKGTNEIQKLFRVTGPAGLGISINSVLNRNNKHPFEVGQHSINDFRLRILKKGRAGKNSKSGVICGDKTVCLGQYDGYLDDLKISSVTHWKNQRRDESKVYH